jgi:hypothetical protein
MALTKADHAFYAKLYEFQKSKSTDFVKLLSLVIGFAFLFFFLILLPYVNLQQKEILANTNLDTD